GSDWLRRRHDSSQPEERQHPAVSVQQAAPPSIPTSPPARAGRNPTSIASFSQASSVSSPLRPPDQGGASSANALVYVVSGVYAHPIRYAGAASEEDSNPLFHGQLRKRRPFRRAHQ